MGSFVDSLPTKPKDMIPGYHPYRRIKAGGKAVHDYTNPKAPPPPPTIDDAALNVQTDDRLRRRRGALANIVAGNQPRPTVGKPTLGG